MLPPPKRKSKARVGEKRRVIDLMSDDETLAPTKQEDLDVNEEDLENLQIASSSGIKAGGCCGCALASEVKLTLSGPRSGSCKG
jgi:hypothetical protein